MASSLHLVLARALDPAVVPGVPAELAWGSPDHVPPDRHPRHGGRQRLALRFARPSPRAYGSYTMDEAVLVDGARLWGYALPAETLSAERIARVPDVCRLNRLVDEHGEDMLVCLEAVAATDSLRKAACQLHRHHNSVAYRVERCF
ncbi:hypothetical protein [Streptomyces sp. UG1]|uniref:hypothetical protein n=1 Tax=Streptomyces sp. UG1 TaxID=3417652 RepID=UPI003CEF8CBB